jgi:opine dehydrogenase
MADEMKIAVLGGGQGAHAMTADMTLRGLTVNMFELPEYASGPIEHTLKTGKIEVSGEVEGIATPNLVTTDLAKALEGVTLIFIVVPTVAQKFFIQALKPHLKEGQTVVIIAGNFASLKVAPFFGDLVSQDKVLLAETSSLPYFARLVGPGKSLITFKTPVAVAAFPGRNTNKVVDQVRRAYPDTTALSDVLEAALCNFNMLGHPAGSLLNAGAIEFAEMNGREYFMYKEGCSPSVARVVGAVDDERRAVAKALGYQLTPLIDILFHLGFSDEPSIYKGLQSPILTVGAGPKGLKHRYISEDIPYLLVPLSELAELVGVDVPVVKSLITIACTLNDTNYRDGGRNLNALGLAGMSLETMKHFLATGEGQKAVAEGG